MARYGKEQKEATRRRIVESAGRRFKRDGIDSSGIATLMADAGLTNGAFYAHFASKDELIATAVGDQLRLQTEHLRELPPGDPASSSLCVGIFPQSTVTPPRTVAHLLPCWTRSGGLSPRSRRRLPKGFSVPRMSSRHASCRKIPSPCALGCWPPSR